MSFDFNNIQAESDDEVMMDSINVCIKEKIDEYVNKLNKDYNSSMNSVKSYNSYIPDNAFEYRHSIYHKTDGLHFYTRNIKNSGLGAWKTLLFWVSSEKTLSNFSAIYHDGAALCSYHFYLGPQSYDDTNHHCFHVMPDRNIKLNLNFIMSYMQIVTKFQADDTRPQFIPYAYAAFRTDRECNFIIDKSEIKNFIKFCASYEDNPIYQIKFSISFAINIIQCYIKDTLDFNATYELLSNITQEYKNIIEQSEDLFLSPKIFANVLYKLNVV